MPARTIAFHPGEVALHDLLKVSHQSNPTAAGLPPSYGHRIAAVPLLALGTLDGHDRPWTTLWGGEAGAVAQPVAENVLGVRSRVDVIDDPVLSALWGVGEGGKGVREGEVVQPGDGGKLLAGLGIDLGTRDRVKFAGRMVAGTVNDGEVQVAIKVEESLGNCPKYLNKKDVTARDTITKGRVERGLPLGERALGVVDRADMLFLTSGYEASMDTNHRGGTRGFVRVVRNDAGAVEIIYPEFSGNRFYQTLGNLKVNPLVGIAIPDFETSDVLYLTGSASILVGSDAAAYLPHTKLAVKIRVAAAVFIESGLPFVGTPLEASPYNPPVRRLFSEQQQETLSSPPRHRRTATLLHREILTPTIARFVFGLEPRGEWAAGQYVTLDFSEELDVGWSHMRDDEPQSLNDDFVRTFTVSCPPGEGGKVEITARRKGPVTDLLWRWNLRVPLEVPVLGFGGDEAFRLGRGDGVEEVFVAAGVGITPLLAQAGGILGKGGKMKVLWSVRGQDMKLVGEVCKLIDGLGSVLMVFVTGGIGEAEEVAILEAEALGATVERRRVEEGDLKDGTRARRFFLCTGPEMLKVLNGWLEGEEVAWEDFTF